ncbi:hypothetical protein FOMPIDRAFT_93279 [Fomitopsis schrenkii]|uniref:Uncharacterized protein n=1 Tax=Fomitopsis schrenkii TaxID=2126942 RepID=S8DYB2_FOMSC|nr:hypothetical protein FOMPIDRAFT_93279 [Fomitopsis schrenkii]
MVGTFEWAEILSKCKEDRADGNEFTEAWAKFEAYTTWRLNKMKDFFVYRERKRKAVRDPKEVQDRDVQGYEEAFDLRKADRFAEELLRTWQQRNMQGLQEGFPDPMWPVDRLRRYRSPAPVRVIPGPREITDEEGAILPPPRASHIRKPEPALFSRDRLYRG